MSEILQLRIELIHTSIWRRVLVYKKSSFYDLHRVIQTVMEWHNAHPHEFRVDQDTFISSEHTDLGFGERSYLSEEKTQLDEFLDSSCAAITYLYDFGDNWRHQIETEELLDKDPDKDYPVCIGGEKQAPPEDCGGVPGYQRILS